MRPCVRYLMAAANLTAARPQDVSSLGLMDILNSGLYCAAASGPAWKRPAVTMRRMTLHFMATPACSVSTQNSNPKGGRMRGQPMSALGQKPTYALQQAMSALPPKADMCGATTDVRIYPKSV